MKRSEFLDIMKELNIVYGEKRFPLSEDVLNVWLRYLGEYEADTLRGAVERFVRQYPYPPTISELITECGRGKEELRSTAIELNRIFQELAAAYPGGQGNAKERETFSRIAGGSLQKGRRALAITRNIVLGWELTGKRDIPPLAEFLGMIKL